MLDADPKAAHWIKAVRIALRDAKSHAEVDRIGSHKRVKDAISDPEIPGHIKREVTRVLHEAYTRFGPPKPDEGDPDLEIVGEKYAAG
jgi:hypothetical protein